MGDSYQPDLEVMYIMYASMLLLLDIWQCLIVKKKKVENSSLLVGPEEKNRERKQVLVTIQPVSATIIILLYEKFEESEIFIPNLFF